MCIYIYPHTHTHTHYGFYKQKIYTCKNRLNLNVSKKTFITSINIKNLYYKNILTTLKTVERTVSYMQHAFTSSKI